MWLWWNQVLVLESRPGLLWIYFNFFKVQESLIGCLWLLLCVITNWTFASFAVFHFCPGFIPEAISVFWFLFPLLLLGKAGWLQDSSGVEASISEIHPLKTRSAHHILSGPRRWRCYWNNLITSLFLVISDSNLELILWLHGSFQLQMMLTKNGTRGPSK